VTRAWWLLLAAAGLVFVAGVAAMVKLARPEF
jgi:hypothetical protein